MVLYSYKYERPEFNVSFEQLNFVKNKLKRKYQQDRLLSAVNPEMASDRFVAVDKGTIDGYIREIKSIYNKNIELLIKIKSKLLVEDRPTRPPFAGFVVPPSLTIPPPTMSVPAGILPPAFRPAGVTAPMPLAGPAVGSAPLVSSASASMPRPSTLGLPPRTLSGLDYMGVPRVGSFFSMTRPPMGRGLMRGGYVRISESPFTVQDIVTNSQTVINNLSILRDLFKSIIENPQFLKSSDVKDILKLHNKFISFFNEDRIPFNARDFAPPDEVMAFSAMPYENIVDNIVMMYRVYNFLFTQNLIPQLVGVTQSLV